MVKFIGEYRAKVDDKGRLIFPSAFKALCPGPFVVKKNLFADCLEMYALPEWERESEAVKARLNPFNKKHDLFWRNYLRDRAQVTPDEKLGRISIPKSMLDGIGIEKEVVFSGNDHKIEIWAKEKFETARMSEEDFVDLAQEILG